jgi:hypothetical protein
MRERDLAELKAVLLREDSGLGGAGTQPFLANTLAEPLAAGGDNGDANNGDANTSTLDTSSQVRRRLSEVDRQGGGRLTRLWVWVGR